MGHEFSGQTHKGASSERWWCFIAIARTIQKTGPYAVYAVAKTPVDHKLWLGHPNGILDNSLVHKKWPSRCRPQPLAWTPQRNSLQKACFIDAMIHHTTRGHPALLQGILCVATTYPSFCPWQQCGAMSGRLCEHWPRGCRYTT